jgi:hypothetical protein
MLTLPRTVFLQEINISFVESGQGWGLRILAYGSVRPAGMDSVQPLGDTVCVTLEFDGIEPLQTVFRELGSRFTR